MEYVFIRSKRKTIGITVESDGTVVLRAPLYCSRRRAEEFLLLKRDWIERAQKKMLERRAMAQADPFTKEELHALALRARKIIPPMVEELAGEMGVDPGRIAIRAQRTRWGSCSSKGNLNFNCLLVLLPENVQRYVVVHELCHLWELNHSKRFWALVSRYQPTYIADRKQLKKDGAPLIARLP